MYSRYLQLYFVVPIPLVQITIFGFEILQNDTLDNITIDDPLTLDCTVAAVRGISSSVDIIWTAGPEDEVISRVYNITANVEDYNATYTDSFEISSLSAIDNGREYQCTAMINASQPVNGSDQISVIFPGKCSCIIRTSYQDISYLHSYVLNMY